MKQKLTAATCKLSQLETSSKKQEKWLKIILDDIKSKNESGSVNQSAQTKADAIKLLGEVYNKWDDLNSEDEWVQLGAALSLAGTGAAMFGGPYGMVAGAAISLVANVIITKQAEISVRGQFSEIKRAFKEYELHTATVSVEAAMSSWSIEMHLLDSAEELVDSQEYKRKLMNFGNVALAALRHNINKYVSDKTKDKPQANHQVYYMLMFCLVQTKKNILHHKVAGKFPPEKQVAFLNAITNDKTQDTDKKMFNFVQMWPYQMHSKKSQDDLYLFHRVHKLLAPSQVKMMNDCWDSMTNEKETIHIYGQKGIVLLGCFDWAPRNKTWEQLAEMKDGWRITDKPMAMVNEPKSGAKAAAHGAYKGMLGFMVTVPVYTIIAALTNTYFTEKPSYRDNELQPLYNTSIGTFDIFEYDILMLPNFKAGKPIPGSWQLVQYNEWGEYWRKFYSYKDGICYGTYMYDKTYDEHTKWTVTKSEKEAIFELNSGKITLTFWTLQDRDAFFDKVLRPFRDALKLWALENTYEADMWDSKWNEYKVKWVKVVDHYRDFLYYDDAKKVDEVESNRLLNTIPQWE